MGRWGEWQTPTTPASLQASPHTCSCTVGMQEQWCPQGHTWPPAAVRDIPKGTPGHQEGQRRGIRMQPARVWSELTDMSQASAPSSSFPSSSWWGQKATCSSTRVLHHATSTTAACAHPLWTSYAEPLRKSQVGVTSFCTPGICIYLYYTFQK